MANGKITLGKQSGGVLNIQPTDGTTNTSLVLPDSGTLVSDTTLKTINGSSLVGTGNLTTVDLTTNQSIYGIKTFTSSPTAPTPVDGDNSTKVATTAFVLANAVVDSDFVSTKAANGYVKLPNGIIIQWGTGASITNYSSTTVTFPIAFTTCYRVIAGVVSSGATTAIGNCKSFTATQAVLSGGDINNGDVSATPVYIAIGV